ncbi:hypothetical protein PMI16_03829 [Herbaspirillum sp. CF444]|uniref:hypothetical protein n=1 Tax=Herbaspirillum sp. CF444 TaxID=1144319 RepID=UPI0002726389|nr:hypothetical protein [Herbaspirillum sp. CF444]EJL84353.1 hypothetical protein PMI16_03829 [Herbaspirillum sp. CF444]
MTTLTANYSAKNTGTVAGKIGTVLRNIFVRFVQAHESQAALLTADQHVEGAAQLNRMANKFESTQPNLAAELRFIASRG